MRIKLDSIQLDTSIQCRAHISVDVVNDYAERMTEGDTFPPVVLYGTKQECWIADGWHRIVAARNITFKDIEAELHPGGRTDALKAALAANSVHGLRRTNEDKRRCIEIALCEFPKLSDRAIAELCGVSDKTVTACRPQSTCGNSAPEGRTGRDGKQYPASRTKADPIPDDDPPMSESYQRYGMDLDSEIDGGPIPDECPDPDLPRVAGPPRMGMKFARIALMQLGEIQDNDLERAEAFATVRGWITDHE